MSLRPLHAFALPLALGVLLILAPVRCFASSNASGAVTDIFDQIADDVSQQLLDSPALQAKSGSGRKVRIVVGDVQNHSDNYDIRVDDIFNEIRNKLVSSGLVRLYAPGELDADFIIAPELTSRLKAGRWHGSNCYSLNLTITAPSGEYIASMSAERCE